MTDTVLGVQVVAETRVITQGELLSIPRTGSAKGLPKGQGNGLYLTTAVDLSDDIVAIHLCPHMVKGSFGEYRAQPVLAPIWIFCRNYLLGEVQHFCRCHSPQGKDFIAGLEVHSRQGVELTVDYLDISREETVYQSQGDRSMGIPQHAY